VILPWKGWTLTSNAPAAGVTVWVIQDGTTLGLAGTIVQILSPITGGGTRMVGLADPRWAFAADLRERPFLAGGFRAGFWRGGWVGISESRDGRRA